MKRTQWMSAAVAVGLVASLAACSSGGEETAADGQKLTVLIGSSGEAETAAVQAAADAWATESGNTVEVIAASDLNQQLGQGFSGNNPPDLFYMGWDQFQTYASNGYLEPYAENLSNADQFYPALKDAFTYDGTFYCAPKDFSTLGLIINTDLWAAAGLTDADIPTDWDGLTAAATALTTGDSVGLSFGQEYARIGVFMNQAGGSLVDGNSVTADSAENVAGIDYVKSLLDAGVLKFPPQLEAGWGGEAFGLQKAAMVIEGPWINGALKNDFPDVKYTAVELPAGPGGDSTFTFSNCWGIPVGSPTLDATQSLVEYLTTDEQQLAFADAFGVIPSTKSGAAAYAEKFPNNASFVAGNDNAVSPVAFAGASAVLGDFNSSLEGLAAGDAKALLKTLQQNLEAAYAEANG
ncbi:MAG: sugar ABC transporter substrate-binding protein [Microbacteriaceae bacterium]